MDYPSQLKLDDLVRADLTSYAEVEVRNHWMERGQWIDRINNLQRDYLARPSEERPIFPFDGASNLVISLTAIAYEAIHASNMQRFRALKNHVAVDIFDTEQQDLDEPLEDYLEQDIFIKGDFVNLLEPAIMELELLGTGVAQATYKKEVRYGYRNGKKFEVVVREGSVTEPIPVTSFLMPFDCLDPQTARWCGHVFWMTPQEIPQGVQSGLFEKGTVEKLAGFYLNSTPTGSALDTTRREEEREKREPVYPQRLQFIMMFTSFCVDKLSANDQAYFISNNIPYDDEDVGREICLIYHEDSRQIVSVWDNWFEDLRRPYVTGNYWPLAYRWAGIGIADQNEQFQKEVTIQHRQTIDNATIANTRMWKVRRGNTSIKDGEPIYPNKIWWVDEMEDVQTFENHEIYPSSYNTENQAVIYSQQRTGVNELTLGMPGVGTPGTATDSMNRIQEGQRKKDYNWSNIHKFSTKLIKHHLLNIVQWGPDIERLRQMPRGSEIEMFLKRPYEDFRKELLCSVKLVDQNDNRAMDRATFTQIAGLEQQYAAGILPLIQQLLNPQTPPEYAEALRTIIRGSNAIFNKALAAFDIRDPDKYLIKVPEAPQLAPPPNVDPRLIGAGQGTPSAPPVTSNFNSSVINAPNLSSVLPAGISGLSA